MPIKPRKPKSEKIRTVFADFLELPEELALDMPRITLVGNLRLGVENHKGIIKYTQEEIRLRVNKGMVSAKGVKLELKNLSSEEILIEGNIREIGIFLDDEGV